MCIGLLFKISHYPNAGLMMTIGMITLGVVIVTMVYLRSTKRSIKFAITLIRQYRNYSLNE